MTVRLKPCPFCGDPLRVSKSGMASHVDQSNCIIGHLGFPTDHPESVARWNNRVGTPALAAHFLLSRESFPEVYDACSNRVKVYKFNAVLRALVETAQEKEAET